MATKEERSRDNSFLDRERRRWVAPLLLSVLGVIALALVFVALTR